MLTLNCLVCVSEWWRHVYCCSVCLCVWPLAPWPWPQQRTARINGARLHPATGAILGSGINGATCVKGATQETSALNVPVVYKWSTSWARWQKNNKSRGSLEAKVDLEKNEDNQGMILQIVRHPKMPTSSVRVRVRNFYFVIAIISFYFVPSSIFPSK